MTREENEEKHARARASVSASASHDDDNGSYGNRNRNTENSSRKILSFTQWQSQLERAGELIKATVAGNETDLAQELNEIGKVTQARGAQQRNL